MGSLKTTLCSWEILLVPKQPQPYRLACPWAINGHAKMVALKAFSMSTTFMSQALSRLPGQDALHHPFKSGLFRVHFPVGLSHAIQSGPIYYYPCDCSQRKWQREWQFHGILNKAILAVKRRKHSHVARGSRTRLTNRSISGCFGLNLD